MTIRQALIDDIPFILSITQNPDNHGFIDALTADALRASMEDPNSELVIWEQAGQAAGFCIYTSLNHPSDRVYLDTLALVNPSSGHGRKFLTSLAEYGFQTLNAFRLWLSVAADNPRAKRAYEKLGFQQEGVFRQHWKRADGSRTDLFMMGLLRDDWKQNDDQVRHTG